MKVGRINVEAIGVNCPYCEGANGCAGPSGSLLITEDEYPRDGSPLVVECVDCGRKVQAPAFPGSRRRPARRQA